MCIHIYIYIHDYTCIYIYISKYPKSWNKKNKKALSSQSLKKIAPNELHGTSTASTKIRSSDHPTAQVVEQTPTLNLNELPWPTVWQTTRRESLPYRGRSRGEFWRKWTGCNSWSDNLKGKQVSIHVFTCFCHCKNWKFPSKETSHPILWQ